MMVIRKRVFEKHFSGRGQSINAPIGRSGRYGISQTVHIGDAVTTGKFLLNGEIFVRYCLNAKLEVVVAFPYSSGKRVFNEAYILSPGEYRALRMEGENAGCSRSRNLS